MTVHVWTMAETVPVAKPNRWDKSSTIAPVFNLTMVKKNSSSRFNFLGGPRFWELSPEVPRSEMAVIVFLPLYNIYIKYSLWC